nr:NAD(P)/FAD-dependent oxidoreductase [Agrobacterium larrymoorei]
MEEDGGHGDFDVVIVGAGFAGLYMLHHLRRNGFNARIFEAADDVGGTWYWNRYPGARCDNESVDYSYSFDEALQQEWHWTERYASQAEILRYIGHVADRYDLRDHITFRARIDAAHFDDACELWVVQTDQGVRARTRYVVWATGCLSATQTPTIPGLDAYRGFVFHTARWPHEDISFAGARVGVIGTGSSAIQLIPLAAAEAQHLTVFQRTPNFSVPARNRPIGPEEERAYKATYRERRIQARQSRTGWVYERNDVGALDVDHATRERAFEHRWETGGVNFLNSFNDLFTDLQSNTTAAEFIRSKIRDIVRDPSIAARLEPLDYPVGTKRICCDSGYYETFNRDNVSLVDLREDPIVCFTPSGIRSSSGREWDFDMVILATGFDAITGAISAIDIRGRAGCELREQWSDGASTYLGLAAAGFPNMFFITGPGSPSVLSNMVFSIEHHVEWIASCLIHLRASGKTTIEPSPDAQDEWMRTVDEIAGTTLFPLANSWYSGQNIPGKPNRFLPYAGGVDLYSAVCKDVSSKGYPGFDISGPP